MRESSGVQFTATGAIEPCPSAQACSCTIEGLGDFAVTAPGYKAVSLHVDAQTDECGNAVGQTIDVNMVPESSSETSMTHWALGKSCGD